MWENLWWNEESEQALNGTLHSMKQDLNGRVVRRSPEAATESNWLFFGSANQHCAYEEGDNEWYVHPTSSTNILGGGIVAGNYWSDYSGFDNNNDGIGDTPYVIPANGTDKYPLVP